VLVWGESKGLVGWKGIIISRWPVLPQRSTSFNHNGKRTGGVAEEGADVIEEYGGGGGRVRGPGRLKVD
jgi:hypothetical protein